MGRKKTYKPKYARELIEYFSRFLEMRDNPDCEGDEERPASGYPTLTKFALKIGVCKNTLYNWAKDDEKFREAMEFASDIQDDVLDERGLSGKCDGKVAMKIRELKINAQRLSGGDAVGGGLKIEIHKHVGSGDVLELKERKGDVNEDTGYTSEN